ncbi:MAG: zf-HC2 domain-containing protein [Acidobacteriia bacterium]|nr:zf-HC2 domain-containing protein [Terriglobia bacterium]
MAEWPKIVQQRMARQASAGNAEHPDANLLAAFAERALVERERAAVSAHLAQCADCRESLALAIAAQSEAEPVADRATTIAKHHWFAEWRWVGAAAAACCVIAVALQVQVQPPPVERTSYTAAPPAASPPVAEKQTIQPAQQVASARKLKVERDQPVEPPPPAPSVAMVQEQKPPEEKVPSDATTPAGNSAALIRPLEPPAQPALTTTILPSAAEPEAFQAGTAEAGQAKKEVAASQALRSRASAFGQGMVARAPVPSARAISALSKPSALWSINASPAMAENLRGVVERSTDAGKTWEAVPLSESVSFRAVASAGSQVWAGGTGGALFHSPDGGAHWERITVSEGNARLTATIVNINAADPNVIKIATSSGERWSSADGGRQWTRH